MELFRLLGRIAVDNTEANNAIDETTNRAEESNKKTGKSFKEIGSAVVSVGKWIAGAGAAIGGSMLAVTESTREYRTEMGKLETAFQTSGFSSAVAKETYMALNGVLGDSAVATEAANHLAKLTDNEQELQTWTNICTGVFATFGDSLPIEGLTESANETAKVGQITGSLADALNWAGVSEDKFNEQLAKCSTEQERQQLITSTLNGIYSESAEKYKEVNKDVIEANEANARLTDSFSKLGEIFEPIVTDVKNKIADMVAVAAPKIQEVIDKIKDGIKWIRENENTIHTWIGVILGAVTSIGTFLIILNWGTIMAAATKAIGAVRNAILLFNAALLANPIGIIVALLAGLVVAFLYLWNNVEPFRQFWIDLWNKVKEVCVNAASLLKTKFTEMYNSMKEKFDAMKQKASDIFNSIKNTISEKVQSAKNVAVSAFNLLKSGLIDPIVSAKNKVSEVFGNIYSTIKEKIESARNRVKEAIDKIKGFFNISLKFNAVKLPSISVSWAKKPAILAKAAELLNIPGVPKFSVSWNALGGILTKPTIFGMGKESLLGGGEAGDEAILPIATLRTYIKEEMNEQNKGIMDVMQSMFFLLQKYLPEIASSGIVLDSGALVGELTPLIDRNMGIIQQRKRGR